MVLLRNSLALFVVFVLCALPVRAQDAGERLSTEQRLRDLRSQISQTEQRLAQTAEAEQTTMQTLRSLDHEIALRRELTASYEARMTELVLENDSLRTALASFEDEFEQLKHQYRRHAMHAYKYGRLHDLALILSASSINQMLVRVRYLNRFADQRKTRLESLELAARTLEDRRQELVEARVQTQLLLREAREEARKMQLLQQSRQDVIQHLRTQRIDLEGELDEQRTAASQLEGRIRELIAAETARRRERRPSNPEEDIAFAGLTGSFTQNRGQIPWPVGGVVLEPYGDLINPVHGTRTPNPGMLIATTSQAEVRAIFEGTVLGVSVLPEYGTYVAIEHGEYQSVYSNLSMVYVAEGTRVKAGQVIGRSGTDAEPKQSALFFAMFKNGSPFDPKPWLRPR